VEQDGKGYEGQEGPWSWDVHGGNSLKHRIYPPGMELKEVESWSWVLMACFKAMTHHERPFGARSRVLRVVVRYSGDQLRTTRSKQKLFIVNLVKSRSEVPGEK
jgi:hypothetical protein